MRNIQEIFDAVIAAGRYHERDESFYAQIVHCGDGPDWMLKIGYDQFMCNSVKIAAARGEITEEESDHARSAIASYLRGWSTLDHSLERHKKPFQFVDRLKIYQNWEDRPNLMSFNQYLDLDIPVFSVDLPVYNA